MMNSTLDIRHSTLTVSYTFWSQAIIAEVYSFYLPGYMLMAMLAAAGVSGIAWLIEKLPSRPVRLVVQSVVMLAIVYVSIAPVFSPYLKAV